jgi:16S rRNA (cytidine1402-2'-O)-methyltransferase
MLGTLSVVATPIGNLEDITLRALRVLKESDIVLCEDTRHSKKLLSHYNIHTPTMSFHTFSGKPVYEKIISLLEAGKSLTLISDAGTPTISDPGAYLIEKIRERLPDIVITPIPGPSSVVAALSVAGVPADSYTFLGFLPHKKGRVTMLNALTKLEGTVVLFESSHRIERLMAEIAERTPERRVVIVHELTKLHEVVREASAEEMVRIVGKDIPARGEFVVILRP